MSATRPGRDAATAAAAGEAMIVVMKTGASPGEVDAVVRRIEELGGRPRLTEGAGATLVSVLGDAPALRSADFGAFEGVDRVVPLARPYPLAAREARPAGSEVKVGGVTIGPSTLTVIAGPCAVESREQTLEAARRVRAAGAHLLRGGAFKPRTSPYSFQGLGRQGLEILAEARRETGLGIVTEVLAPEDVPLVAETADVLQVGARNMQNFPLLAALGRQSKPVLLKRGFMSTIEELLLSAEHVLSKGNRQVILCERGVRGFDAATRNTLDLSAVPVVHRLSHLPIVVDPSHASGVREYVPPLARAAVAAGADGIMIEVHPRPELALCDGPESLTPDDFGALMATLGPIARAVGRRLP